MTRKSPSTQIDLHLGLRCITELLYCLLGWSRSMRANQLMTGQPHGKPPKGKIRLHSYQGAGNQPKGSTSQLSSPRGLRAASKI
jgi:hypothetical protein